MAPFKIPVVLVLLASACGAPPDQPPPVSPAPTAADGTVVSGCPMRVRDEFEQGLRPRALRVGPAAFVTFGIHEPLAPRPGAVNNFKVMVEIRPDAKVTAALPKEATHQAALLFDRGRTRDDNAYTLTDGTHTVQFETCPGKPTTFVGAIATTGPTQVPLDITVDGDPPQRITLAVRP